MESRGPKRECPNRASTANGAVKARRGASPSRCASTLVLFVFQLSQKTRTKPGLRPSVCTEPHDCLPVPAHQKCEGSAHNEQKMCNVQVRKLLDQGGKHHGGTKRRHATFAAAGQPRCPVCHH